MKKKFYGILSVLILLCFLLSGCQELSNYAAGLLEAKCDEMIDHFNQIALYSRDKVKYNGVTVRWETPITMKVIGDYTEEDYSTLTRFVDTLNSLNVIPRISIIDKDANFFVYFVPIDKMAENIPDYNKGDWWSYTVYWKPYKINKAYLGIATDVSTQEERNYMILMAISGSLGFLNTSDKYPESIFYSKWTKAQELSDIDYDLIRMLYSPSLHAGMNEEEAKEALLPLVKAKYIDTYLD